MPIYQTATYRVRAEGVGVVREAIDEFVEYVRANEPGTLLYHAWQSQEDPTRSSTCSSSPTRRPSADTASRRRWPHSRPPTRRCSSAATWSSPTSTSSPGTTSG